MDDNIFNLSNIRNREPQPKEPEYTIRNYTVYFKDGEKITVRGYLVIMGGYYFIGSGPKDRLEVLFSTDTSLVNYVIADDVS